MKHRISLSVMPSYYCEYNCKFCYLGDLRKNKERLKIGLLNSQIKDIVTKYDVEQCLVYGGEISLLPIGYLYSMLSLLFRYLDTVSIVSMLSNLSVIAQLLDKFPALQISTSYNFDEYSKLIENRIQKLKQFYKKPIVVNTLVSKALISKDIKEIEMFDTKKQTWRARGRLPAAYKNQGGTSILKIYGNESSDVFLINRRLFIFKI